MVAVVQRAKTGFTLVELLVVIAIMALLIALLTPVVRGALNRGRTSGSIQNLKSIHTLVLNYMTDHDGRYPLAVGSNEAGSERFWRREVWENSYGPFEGNVEAAMARSDYANVMWCPLMVSRHGQAQHPGGRGSYGMNGFFNQQSYGQRFMAAGALRGAKEPYVMAGNVLNDFGTNEEITTSDPAAEHWQSMAFVYGGGEDRGLALYVDGHVAQLSREEGVELDPLISDYLDFE